MPIKIDTYKLYNLLIYAEKLDNVSCILLLKIFIKELLV